MNVGRFGGLTMRKGPIPYELIDALQEYLDRHPKQKDIKICSKGGSIQMGDMPKEIEEGTELGIDYEKALYKMAFEDLIDGRKTL